jgi:predicted DCC family thiol-disulfide oxidoreductase YuxK
MNADTLPTTIVYDGDCPFCSRYVALVRLREAAGPVTLANARDGGPLVDDLRRRGYDLDQGMVLIYAGEIFYGAECMNRLALMSTRSTAFNRLHAAIFRRPALAAALYPALRAGRNLVLRLLGRRKIADGLETADASAATSASRPPTR